MSTCSMAREPKPTGDRNAPLRTVKEVVFGLLSPSEILNLSVTPEGIQFAQVYDADGSPLKCGLLDPRMGAVDKAYSCLTCKGRMGECLGHFGHIELCEPVFHVLFLTKVLKILQCVCYYCHKLLVSPESPHFKEILDTTNFPDRRRFNKVYKLCKGKNVCNRESDPLQCCNYGDYGKKGRNICGRRQPKYKLVGLEIFIEWEDMDEKDGNRVLPFYPKCAREILADISDKECKCIGMDPRVSRPEWMVTDVFVVPPLSVRPIAVTFGGSRNQDDLTFKLGDIVSANNALRAAQESGAVSSALYDLFKFLQYHCATLVDNSMRGVPKSVHRSSGKMIKCLKARLKGKEGRIRGNLMGKRVDFSARTVISPDPCLKVDEVGIPKMIAESLTYTEMVTPYNVERMEELVGKGTKHYPGAKCVVKPNGDRIDLRYTQLKKMKLRPGYKVERDLIDGDIVVFNRQPSLHKMSMMGHRVKVLPHTTFRMNLSCTTPYNADFDGDEMNLHVPQSIDVVAEIESLLLSTRNIVTPRSNRPVMGIVQDSLTGAQKLTRRDVFIDKGALMNLLMQATTWNGVIPKPAIIKPTELWTGKQLFSLIIPGRLNLVKKHSTHPDDEDDGPFKWASVGDTKVIVDQGELICGILCRNTLGTASGSLLHVCMMELGHEATGIFYNDIQNVINWWLRTNAHSIGFQDFILADDTNEKLRYIIKKAKEEVNVLSHQESLRNSKSVEQEINSILNNAVNEAGRLVHNCLDDSNRLKTMVTAGSKGSLINIAQITACIGQVNVAGKGITKNFGNRTLPHFEENDNSPESRGFVENSFFTGLEPHEYFFHSMGGREGLIDTAVKTAETGYIQRRLMKAMESVMVQYDGTVRNSLGQIIEFCYGEDGLSSEKVEFQTLPTILLTNDEFRDKYKFEVAKYGETQLRDIFTADVVREILSDSSLSEILNDEWDRLGSDRKELRKIFPMGDDRVVLPCNLRRMITNIQKLFRLSASNKSSLNPKHVVEKVKSLVEGLRIFHADGQMMKVANQNATFLFSCLLRSMLFSKGLCEKYRFSKEAFHQLLINIQAKFEEAKVEAGEMVGAIAAQSIGEPATQMTLNTFHFAGVSSMNVTLGIPRLKEIINISKNPKSPSTTVYLKNGSVMDEIAARKVACRLKSTALQDIVCCTSIFEDLDLRKSVRPEDQSLLDAHLELPLIDNRKLSKWCLRLELDRKKVANENISMEVIAAKVNEELGKRGLCLYSDDNSEILFLRVFLVDCDRRVEDEELYLQCILSHILSLRMKGIAAVTDAVARRTTGKDGSKMKVVVDESGGYKRVSEWIIETRGSALLEVMVDPDVDPKRTYSSDIWDVYNTLGIEAARKTLEIEFRSVLADYGLYVNYRHLSTLCSVMTSKGYLMPITRYGVNRQGLGPLMRCSFEETADVLVDAAVHSERDYIRGVSEHVIMGQTPRMGTGAFDLILDPQKCAQAKPPVDVLSLGRSELKKESKRMQQAASTVVDLYSPMDLDVPTAVKVFPEKPSLQSLPLCRPGDGCGSAPSLLASLSAEWEPVASNLAGDNIANRPTYSISASRTAITSPPYSFAANNSYSEYNPSAVQYSLNSPPYVPPTVQYSQDSPPYKPAAQYSLNSPPYVTPTVQYSPISPPYKPAVQYSSNTTPCNPPEAQVSALYNPAPVVAGSCSLVSPEYTPSSVQFTVKSPPYSQVRTHAEAEAPSCDPSDDRGPLYFGSSWNPEPSGVGVMPMEHRDSTAVDVPADNAALQPCFSPLAPAFSQFGSNYNPKL